MIYLCGDTHGKTDLMYLNNWYHKNNHNITEDDVLIQLGDWGAIWDNSKQDKNLQVKWAKKKFQTLVIPGNHENYDIIETLPITEIYGAKARVLKAFNQYNPKKEYKNIYLIERGEVLAIQGKKFLALGGARSIDKIYRTEHISWWKQEEWTYSQQMNCLKNLDEHNWEVDYVVSHTIPSTIINIMFGGSFKYSDSTANFFDEILRDLKFKHWYFGHFHEDRDYKNFSCLYKKIHSIDE